MVHNSNNHLSCSLLRQRVKCDARHIDIKVYVVEKKVRNHNQSIEHKSNKKVLADLLTKGLPPSVFGEHTVDMG